MSEIETFLALKYGSMGMALEIWLADYSRDFSVEEHQALTEYGIKVMKEQKTTYRTHRCQHRK